MNSSPEMPAPQADRAGDFLEFIEKNCPAPFWIYRGQQRVDTSWPLLPKAGRPPFDDPQSRDPNAPKVFHHLPEDLAWFNEWRDNAIAFSKSILDYDEFDCLAYAQHYGLATRLLDWTSNPLAALFFAVEAHPCHDAVDGAVFAYSSICHVERVLGIQKQAEKYPRVAVFKPRPFDPRILCQSAWFTYHPEPHVPLGVGGKDGTLKIMISAGVKREIQIWLNTMGVNRKTLFPGLEGLSASINWWYTHLRKA